MCTGCCNVLHAHHFRGGGIRINLKDKVFFRKFCVRIFLDWCYLLVFAINNFAPFLLIVYKYKQSIFIRSIVAGSFLISGDVVMFASQDY